MAWHFFDSPFEITLFDLFDLFDTFHDLGIFKISCFQLSQINILIFPHMPLK